MSPDTVRLKKLLIRALPYILIGLVCTNLGEAWRMAEGANASEKLLSFFTTMGIAFGNPLPSFHPIDLMVGLICGAGLRVAVYIRGKNAKNFKHNLEYGSARWRSCKGLQEVYGYAEGNRRTAFTVRKELFSHHHSDALCRFDGSGYLRNGVLLFHDDEQHGKHHTWHFIYCGG